MKTKNCLIINTALKYYIILLFGIFSGIPYSYSQPDSLQYTISFKDASKNLFHVQLKLTCTNTGVIDFSIPSWTPGYYQLLNFEQNIQQFKASSEKEEKPFSKLNAHTWRVAVNKGENLEINYTVLANIPFIARPYIDSSRAFIRPTGVFIYPVSKMGSPVQVKFTENKWSGSIAGLDRIPDGFVAENIDELLDAPILVGDLEELKSFEVKGKPHYFFGRDMGEFDKDRFIKDVEKIVTYTVELMQDIPYKHYSFIAIGRGNGGIEQTNSTAISFNGNGLNTEGGRQRMLNFITHEYFHHYNIKRIRPIELGPFDYNAENRTNMLWVGEGLSVYYEAIIMNRAGIKSSAQMLSEWEALISRYENNEGKNHQTLAQASYHTWEDGPFGRKGETISVYEKGPLIGMLLDLKIRAATNNKNSLDDVMRKLYYKFYKEGNRGYTEQEVKEVCETIAGTSLEEIFSYIYTTDSIDYNKYFTAAGLTVKKVEAEGKQEWKINRLPAVNTQQQAIFKSLFRD